MVECIEKGIIMIIKVLVEDNNEINEHGLSLYIEYVGQKILFDTGQSDLYLNNAKKMSVDLSSIDFVVLSHGHYDHGNGLVHLSKTTLLCHPKVFLRRYRNQTYIGLNQTRKEVEEKFNLVATREPYFITKDICFLGEVNPRETKYVLEDGSTDYIPDDSALAINSKDGIIIITGCSHAGILNIIEKSKEIFNKNKIYAIVGGFHLKEINTSLDEVVESLNNIEHIYTGHCTSQQVIDYLNEKGLEINKLKSLMTIEI